MNKSKINFIKLAQIGGAVLTLAATLISNWVSEKQMQEEVKEEVSKQLEERK